MSRKRFARRRNPERVVFVRVFDFGEGRYARRYYVATRNADPSAPIENDIVSMIVHGGLAETNIEIMMLGYPSDSLVGYLNEDGSVEWRRARTATSDRARPQPVSVDDFLDRYGAVVDTLLADVLPLKPGMTYELRGWPESSPWPEVRK